jgi:UDP-N-acetylglucosamine transferase subunit ALG13
VSTVHTVVVSLGTDHHRFDRLVGWIDAWLEQQESPPTCIVQYGSSTAPLVAEGIDLVSRELMLDLYLSASVIVVQGGPGSIFDARSVGRIPIAVPRRARYHEVVDDHQVAFCRQLEAEGEIRLAESQVDLVAALDRALADPASMVSAPRPSPAPIAAAALRTAMDGVLARRPGLFSVTRGLQTLVPEGWRRRDR